ncbi:hypothetical protein JCM13664_08280 [Methylothermus subterraneus]
MAINASQTDPPSCGKQRKRGAFCRSAFGNQTGLTLLELVVSLLVLTILTSVAIRSVSGIQEQARYEKTVRLLEEFRQAIVGDGDWSKGIRAYALDMGTLPPNLRALMVEPTTTAMRWGDAVTFIGMVSIHMGVGWRGPYLATSGSADHPDTLRDGFGGTRDCDNDGIQDCDSSADTTNYGWYYAPFDGVSMTILSHGADALAGPAGTCGQDADYEEDCKLKIPLNSWTISAPFSLSMHFLSGDADTNPHRLCLRIYTRKVDNDSSLDNNIVSFSPVTSVSLDVVTGMTVTWNFNTPIPAGQNYAVVVECDAGILDTTVTIYPAGKLPVAIDMRPGSTIPVIDW